MGKSYAVVKLVGNEVAPAGERIASILFRLTEEEKKQIEALGGWEKLMETLKKRLEEQEKRHQGGNKWVGTGGTSPYGNSG